jgi:2-desacetyl-2-hydroxyethyl bacteriochlorophyllide A dehydrogenase
VKAVVIERPHEAAYRDVERPACGPEDVLVKSRRAGVCRTDLDVLLGVLDRRWVRYPCIPGHEWTGVVAEVGDAVFDLSPGERVVCEGIVPCLRCRRCKAGDTNLCEHYEQLGFTRGGGYGEYVLVPPHVVHRLPADVPEDSAVLVEPAAVVLRGLERGRPAPGERVAVVGVGTLGAIALRLARLFGPSEVHAIGLRDEELEFARLLGADAAYHPDSSEGETGTFDLVLECAGSAAAVELGTRLAREGGRVVALGIAGEGKRLDLPADRLALRDLELIGSISYTSAVWSHVVSLVSDGLVDLGGIVTRRIPVAQYEDAFALMQSGDGVGRFVLEHDPGEGP